MNIFSIGIFFGKDIFHKPPQQDRSNDNRSNDNRSNDNRDVLSILERELNLTEKQSEEFKKIRSDFPDKERAVREVLNKERDSLNEEAFKKNPDEEKIKSLARKIADNEYKVELLRYEQAKEMKAICTAEQQEKFEVLIKEIRDYLRDNKQRKKK
ncbi:MAG: Spy/CpxP family protein refolding chaperone [Ignavibacteria bacterium]